MRGKGKMRVWGGPNWVPERKDDAEGDRGRRDEQDSGHLKEILYFYFIRSLKITTYVHILIRNSLNGVIYHGETLLSQEA